MARWMLCFLAVVVAVSGAGIPATAAQYGSVQISMDYGVNAGGAEVVLYSVARPVEGGYRLDECYGGGVIRQDEALSPELAQWLAQRCTGEGIRCSLDESGNGKFTGLSQGLYMLIQTSAPKGWACTLPFLVSIPLNGEWEILAKPKKEELLTPPPKTGQHPAPIFASMGLVLSGLGLYMCFDKLRKK